MTDVSGCPDWNVIPKSHPGGRLKNKGIVAVHVGVKMRSWIVHTVLFFVLFFKHILVHINDVSGSFKGLSLDKIPLP